MSSTRKAAPGGPLRQERWSSDPAYEGGLKANLVADRCELLSDPADVELVFFVQYLSWQRGGLAKLAADLISRFPERLVTPSMSRFGFREGQDYNARQVRVVREEMEIYLDEKFTLRGERAGFEEMSWEDPDPMMDPDAREDRARREAELTARASGRPDAYPASEFVSYCRRAAQNKLPDILAELCLKPEPTLDAWRPWFFRRLVESLRELQRERAEGMSSELVETAVSRLVFDSLDYALDCGGLVLLEGSERIGKSWAARNWCLCRPGRARYLEVPSSRDDKAFFSSIAEALGVSCALNAKAVELRERVEAALKSSKLMLVLDQGHDLFPGSRHDSKPFRVNWMMTAIADRGVPAAIIATPQFSMNQREVERRAGWRSGQFIGRLAHYDPLPERLEMADLVKLARFHLPEADAETAKVLAAYALTSKRHAASIQQAAKRVRFEAARAGKAKITLADVWSVIEKHATPTDNAIRAVLNQSPAAPRSRLRPGVTAGQRIPSRAEGSQPDKGFRDREQTLSVPSPAVLTG